MGQRLKILIVEDQPADAELLQYEMRRAGIDYIARRVDTRESFHLALTEFHPDLILSDFSMPSFDGFTALGLARAVMPETPFIFVSGTIGEERALDALKNGATDYVLKDRPKRVISAIQRALIEAKERAELRDSQEAIQSSEKRFRSFVQHMPGAAAIMDLHGRYEFVNEHWERALGKAAHEVLGLSCEDLLPPDSAARLARLHRQVVETGKPASSIFRCGTGDAARWWCSSFFPVSGREEKPSMIGSITIDITDQKAAGDAIDGVDSRGPGRAL